MQRIGRYDVERELGQGGMGRVFVATDPALKRAVALKLLHRSSAAQAGAREQFRAEAQTLAALSHPGIVTIFEIGEHDDQQFIAMEYLDGRSLRELLLDPAHKPDRDRLLAICASVGVAVAAAHAAGILHRDIKPENVVVGHTGVVKVVDFGIARRLDADGAPAGSPATRATAVIAAFTRTLQLYGSGGGRETAAATVVTAATRTVFGTPAYMAPEVLEGAPSSEASDVYSLGVMIYECLAGRRPYEAGNVYELIARVVDGSEPPPALADPLGAFVLRMLARDPAQRPTLAELATVLAPPAASPRAPRWRVPVLVAAAVAVLGVAAVAIWRLTASEHDAPLQVRVAVDRLPTELASYGAGPPPERTVGDVLAILLGTTSGVTVISPGQLEQELRPGESTAVTATRLGARWLVRGSIGQRAPAPSGHPELTSRVELVDLTTGAVIPIAATAPSDHFARIETELAGAIAAAIPPAGRRPNVDHLQARTLYDLGVERMNVASWLDARVYFEQAVEIEPTLPEGWARVASVRSWSIAPETQIEDAIDHALAGVTSETERQIWSGAKLVYRYEFAHAIAILQPLVGRKDLDANAASRLDYYLGEAYFHDGDLKTGVSYLRKVLDRRVPFKPAGGHVAQYALVHRDYAEAMSSTLLYQGKPQIELARGNYEQLARTDFPPFNFYAYLLLDRPPPANLDINNPWIVELAKLGQLTGDRAAARRAFAAIWNDLGRAPPLAASEHLQELIELVITAGLADEARQILDHARPERRQLIWFPRYEILAAPLLGTPRAFPREGLTTRDAKIASAVEAELAGDRARAATLMAAIIADPSSYWDYAERALIVRNLRALGRRRELAALCAEIAHPPVFRLSWLPLRRACRGR